jgi:hypothetical protein
LFFETLLLALNKGIRKEAAGKPLLTNCPKTLMK